MAFARHPGPPGYLGPSGRNSGQGGRGGAVRPSSDGDRPSRIAKRDDAGGDHDRG